jgi:hypothetical protein
MDDARSIAPCRAGPAPDDPRLASRGAGEAAAITLALSLPADLVLMDDRAGVAAARAKRLNVMLSSPDGQLVSWSQTRRCGGRATGVSCRQEGSLWASFRFNYPAI